MNLHECVLFEAAKYGIASRIVHIRDMERAAYANGYTKYAEMLRLIIDAHENTSNS